jgi:hypothetical protein
MMDSLSTFATHFPKPTLTVISDHPSHDSLLLLQKELNQNASSVASNSGNGLLGHLVLTEDPVILAAMPGHVPFPAPANPGSTPAHPPNASNANITENNRLHLLLLQSYRLYHAVDKALLQLLLAAVPLSTSTPCPTVATGSPTSPVARSSRTSGLPTAPSALRPSAPTSRA